MYYLILEILFAAENYVSLPHQQICMAKFAQLENIIIRSFAKNVGWMHMSLALKKYFYNKKKISILSLNII